MILRRVGAEVWMRLYVGILLLLVVAGCTQEPKAVPMSATVTKTVRISCNYPDLIEKIPFVKSMAGASDFVGIWRVYVNGVDYGQFSINGSTRVDVPADAGDIQIRARYQGMTLTGTAPMTEPLIISQFGPGAEIKAKVNFDIVMNTMSLALE
jgi:hypothetical protein